MESFERRVVRTMYPGTGWQSVVDKMSEPRIQVVYSEYIGELLEKYRKMKEQQT